MESLDVEEGQPMNVGEMDFEDFEKADPPPKYEDVVRVPLNQQ